MSKSKIEWCDRTWNPVTGCTPISAGCANCYAKRMAERFAGPWGLDPANPFAVQLHPERLDEPMRWKKPSMIFVCSMSDLIHDDVPFSFIHEVWDAMKKAPQHTFLILTKRPERMKEVVERIYSMERMGWSMGFWNHVWLGVTIENQEQADKRTSILLSIWAAKHFVSVEPMLGAVDLQEYLPKIVEIMGPDNEVHYRRPVGHKDIEEAKKCKGYWLRSAGGLDWVICGGESGPGARPMHSDWVRILRDQCNAAGTPFMFKQWGEWCANLTEAEYNGSPLEPSRVHWVWPDGQHESVGKGNIRHGDGSVLMHRIGKHAAGRLLDGKEWLQYPDGGAKCTD